MLTSPKIRNPRLNTSYALSPQTRFLCPPCSVHRRYKPSENTQQVTQRLTYAVTSEPSGRKAELICFVEEAQKSSALDTSGGIQDKRSFELDSRGSVASLLALTVDSESAETSSALDICVVYTSGETQCISGDLTSQRWQTAADNKANVEYAAVFDLDTARKGLLKSREDATAILESTNDTNASKSRTLLAVIDVSAQSGSNAQPLRRLKVYALPPRSKDLISSIQRGPQEILSYFLPASSGVSSSTAKAEYMLQASSGRLQQLSSGVITSYDLSGTLPRIASVIPPQRESGYQSFTRLSPTTVLASEANLCGIYDIMYTSVQARLTLESEPGPSGKHGKGKSTIQDPLRFVSYFSEIGLAVAVRGSNLVGMQVNNASASRKRARTRAGLLVDSLGKGIAVPNSSANLADWKARVDAFVDDGNVDGLEELVAGELDISRVKPSKSNESGDQNADNQTNDETHEEPLLLEWRFPKDISGLVSRTDRRKALYCLGKFFAFAGDTQNSAIERQAPSILFFAPNIFKWLALTGYLTADMINRGRGDVTGGHTNLVKPGDMIKAIHDFDPSLGLMHEVLSWPIYLQIDEVVTSLKVIIESLESPIDSSEIRAITNSNGDESMVNGELESAVESEVEAADQDLAFALASLNDGLAIRSLALRSVFSRLHSFPATRIVESFRSNLTQQEIVFFIQLLRIELADGSWTTRYVDNNDDFERQDGPSDRSIIIIGDLLNIAIDTIGTSGWLVGLSGDSQLSTDDMLVMLRAETSAALEGCYEARTLGTYLNDFERYGHVQQKTGYKRKREVDPVKNPGFLVSDEAEDPVLPLGYKVQKIDKTRLTAGGQVRTKSKGAIGREISMRVGKYSIDRIRV